jgi:vacuolar-type H+-ATPase subunit C/Vma6
MGVKMGIKARLKRLEQKAETWEEKQVTEIIALLERLDGEQKEPGITEFLASNLLRQLFDKAMKGNMTAIKYILDKAYGPPPRAEEIPEGDKIFTKLLREEIARHTSLPTG